MNATYQILPPLLPDEFEALKTSIAERGVDVPIIVDQEGNIIDGYHRMAASDDLGIYCPREVRQFESETDKLELVLRLNCGRRQLNRQQKRSVIDAYLLRDPQIADNFLAQIIGVSKNTVADVRSEMEATCQIDKFEVLRGKDGKQRPVKYKKIIANTPKESETALSVIGDLPDNCAGKLLDITTAKRRAAKNQNAKKREEQRNLVEPLSDDDIRLYHCPFQKLEEISEIEPESVQLVCTDIPYDKSFLPQIDELGQFAHRVLVEGGLLVTYSGHYWLPQVIELLGRSLTYRWTRASIWDGDATPVQVSDSRVITAWKPILIFSKGEMPNRLWYDVTQIDSKEKYWHPWQQPLAEVEKLIEAHSNPGDLVVDTCGGGFTTAIASLNKTRRFIGCDIDEKNVAAGQERLRLNRELDAYIFDMHDMDDPVDNHRISTQWAMREGVDAECASHVLTDMSDDIRALVVNSPLSAA